MPLFMPLDTEHKFIMEYSKQNNMQTGTVAQSLKVLLVELPLKRVVHPDLVKYSNTNLH